MTADLRAPMLLILAIAHGATVPRSLGATAFQCPDGSPPPCPGARTGPPANSVAVLPFENLSRDTGDAYLARDLTEEVTTRLIRVERLTVTSPTVVRRYRGSDDPRTVAQALGVAYLVSGSVRRDRDRLRISVELFRARDGVAPWTDVFDQRDTSLLDIQIQIAQAVARGIAGRLLPAEQQRLAARPTRDPRAYDHFARANHQVNQRTTRSLLRALQELRLAVQLDSMFGSALALQAVSYTLLATAYYDSALVGLPRDSLLARARVLAQRAPLVDPTSAAAWVVAAHGEPPARQREIYERASALEPRNPSVLTARAYNELTMGDTARYEVLMRQAIAADPSDPTAMMRFAMQLQLRGRYAEAVRWLDSAVALRPDGHFFYANRARARLLMGDTSTMRADAAECRRLGRPFSADALLLLLAVAGRDTAAVRTLTAALRQAVAAMSCYQNHDCPEGAAALAAAGDRQGALELLERVTPRSEWFLGDWLLRADFDPIRNDPRFQRIVADVRASANR